MTVNRRSASWLVLALVLGAALLVGASGDGTPETPAERVQRIASRLRCPTCQGLSVRDSDAPAARSLRDEIARRVSEGQPDGEIVGYVVSRYGDDVLLDPPKEGVSLLVWLLPVVGAAAAGAALVLAFRRWRPGRGAGGPSDEDRALVEQALRQ